MIMGSAGLVGALAGGAALGTAGAAAGPFVAAAGGVVGAAAGGTAGVVATANVIQAAELAMGLLKGKCHLGDVPAVLGDFGESVIKQSLNPSNHRKR